MKLDSVDPKAEVPFNTKEQPIGNASVQLASVLGVLVRRSIPLTPQDWRFVDNVSKENIWKIATQRFIVPECFKDYYISKMGTYLKEARSRKAGAVLKVLDNLQVEEREKQLEKIRPTSMTVNEWEAFVKYVNSPEFRVQRLRMQGFRKKYDTPHTISRQGYARLEAEMQEELKTAEEIERVDLWKKGHKPRKEKGPHLKKIEKAQAEHGASSGSSVTEDVLAKALGETEKTKRLKGLGFGAMRKKIVAQSHYKKIIKECQESCKAMNDRLLVLEERNLKCVCNEVTHSHRAIPTDINNQASTSRIVFCNERASSHTPNTSPVSRTNEVQVPVKFKCKLLSWIKEGGQVVADAEIVETDPEKEIDGYPIGLNCYFVSVITAHVEKAPVFKPTDAHRTLKDAEGDVITWPKDRSRLLC
ncbi:hypothetical protein MKW94_007702 [Papaver nudicaule]|uniref:Transposase n=1 Tax=Papaver nudicaule TaxID=74823 RepID=A0AA42B0K4_PAPNU|nr:hypothetical protein [Papaver nudicaule]